MDFEGLLRQGEVDVIRQVLNRHIHRFGKVRDSRRLLMDMTGEDFKPQYYVEYLKEKYGKLYGVEV